MTCVLRRQDTEPQVQDGEAGLTGARLLQAEMGCSGERDMALMGRVLRTDHRAWAVKGSSCRVCPVISPPFWTIQVGTGGLRVEGQSPGPCQAFEASLQRGRRRLPCLHALLNKMSPSWTDERHSQEGQASPLQAQFSQQGPPAPESSSGALSVLHHEGQRTRDELS